MNDDAATAMLKSAGASWDVRPYQHGDETQIVALFRETFGKPLTEERYRWKVINSPWPIGASPVWLADTGGRIVGHYAGTAMRFLLQGEERRIVHACDAMTAGLFRRQGVLTAVGSAAHDAWAMAGAPFVTGLHFGGWGSRRHHLGWREQYPATWLWRHLRAERMVQRRMHLPTLAQAAVTAAGSAWNATWALALWQASRGIEILPVEHPGSEFDTLWFTLKSHYEALVVRDRAWVTYRYAEAPGDGYRLLLALRDDEPVGYVAYRITAIDGRVTGWLADLFTAPDDMAARAGLLRAALLSLEIAGADHVRAIVPVGTPVFAAFRRAGFVVGPGSFDFSIVPLETGLPLDLFPDPNRWFAMGGDFDVI